MTCLLRCRGSTSEMAEMFGADPLHDLEWRETIWTGEALPTIRIVDGARQLSVAKWGLPAMAFARSVPTKQRGALYPRDLTRSSGRLVDPMTLERCLIVIEAFAYPVRQHQNCTRGWIGLIDHPLTAWAGVRTDDGCAGLLILANTLTEPLSDTMPRLLNLEDQQAWLEGRSLLSLGMPYEDAAFYYENLSEGWSSGQLAEEAPLFCSRPNAA